MLDGQTCKKKKQSTACICCIAIWDDGDDVQVESSQKKESDSHGRVWIQEAWNLPHLMRTSAEYWNFSMTSPGVTLSSKSHQFRMSPRLSTLEFARRLAPKNWGQWWSCPAHHLLWRCSRRSSAAHLQAYRVMLQENARETGKNKAVNRLHLTFIFLGG